MANIFQTILQKGIAQGTLPNLTQQARDWYRDQASGVSTATASPTKAIQTAESTAGEVTGTLLGKMLLFTYDPKTKQQLPYYDKFPLIFPFARAPGGFYGLNMHYLPLPYRAKLMDGLYSVATDNRYDERTRLRLSYEVLLSSSRFRFFRPCVKHYLNTGMRSRFAVIPSNQWDIALFLPLERFQKANKETVYQDSRKIIRGY
jgi:hypothetical protein